MTNDGAQNTVTAISEPDATGLFAEANCSDARALAQEMLAGTHGPAGDDELAFALTAFGIIASREGRIADALGLLRAAVARTDDARCGQGRALSRLALSYVLVSIGRLEEAEACARAAVDQVDGRNLQGSGAPSIFLARALIAAGRVEDAVHEAERGLAIANKHRARIFVPLAATTLASAALMRRDLRAAAHHIVACRADVSPRQPTFGEALFAWTEGRVRESREGPTAAVHALTPLYDDARRDHSLFLQEPGAAAWMTRAALAAGAHRRAVAVVLRAENLADDNDAYPTIRASAEHARGLLDNDVERIERAVVGHVQPWARASAMEDAGVVSSLRGTRQATVALLERALTTYEGIAADRDAERVRSRLRATRGRRRERAAARPVAGWNSLTDTEHRVTALVAEGMTNREVATSMFLSRHTIDFHLRQVFRKLGVRSRVQLARLALEQGAPQPADVGLG